jgi:hypothetical protein
MGSNCVNCSFLEHSGYHGAERTDALNQERGDDEKMLHISLDALKHSIFILTQYGKPIKHS